MSRLDARRGRTDDEFGRRQVLLSKRPETTTSLSLSQSKSRARVPKRPDSNALLSSLGSPEGGASSVENITNDEDDYFLYIDFVPAQAATSASYDGSEAVVANSDVVVAAAATAVEIRQGCLLLPVAVAFWFYWTKRAARRMWKRGRARLRQQQKRRRQSSVGASCLAPLPDSPTAAATEAALDVDDGGDETSSEEEEDEEDDNSAFRTWAEVVLDRDPSVRFARWITGAGSSATARMRAATERILRRRGRGLRRPGTGEQPGVWKQQRPRQYSQDDDSRRDEPILPTHQNQLCDNKISQKNRGVVEVTEVPERQRQRQLLSSNDTNSTTLDYQYLPEGITGGIEVVPSFDGCSASGTADGVRSTAPDHPYACNDDTNRSNEEAVASASTTTMSPQRQQQYRYEPPTQ